MIASENVRGYAHSVFKQQQQQQQQRQQEQQQQQQQQQKHQQQSKQKAMLKPYTTMADIDRYTIPVLDSGHNRIRPTSETLSSPTDVSPSIFDYNIAETMISNLDCNANYDKTATATATAAGTRTRTDTLKPNTNLIPSHPTSEIEIFLRRCIEEIITMGVFQGTTRSNKVVEWTAPNELQSLFNLRLNDKPASHDDLFDLLKKTIKYSVKTGHPYFVNQLYSGLDPYGLIGQWLTDALNPSVYTYEVAPVFTLMEEEVLAEMRKIVGFPNNGFGDGIFCPGGSISNGYAISCARYYKTSDVKINGLFEMKRQIIYTSEDAHYSIEKLATFMGIGNRNVCKIKTNKLGKMDINDLEEQIKRSLEDNCEPMMVSATAGTTVLGAFDDLKAISKVCKKHNVWMHVDAAWGGGALVSQKYRHLLNGIELSDSVTWNPHKMLTSGQQCSTFLTRHKDILTECHSTYASYLFQKDKFYDTSYDTGDKHIQCGRRADVFKFWFMWKAKGTRGLEEHVNHLFKISEFLRESIRQRSDRFELVLNMPECTNISFWYIPPSLRNVERNSEFYSRLNNVAPKIKERMVKEGSMMITYQPLRELPNFFRVVLQNSCLTEADMLYILDKIEYLGDVL